MAAVPPVCRGTTQISVVDAAGGVASLSVSNGEGSAYVLPGTGIILNNMLGEADLLPDGVAAWQRDCRLSSMMTPAIVRDSVGGITALGSGGSNRIRTAILQTLLNLQIFGMSPEEAVAAPRLHWEEAADSREPATLSVEPGFAEDAVAAAAAGQRLAAWPGQNLFFGGVHTVRRSASGAFDGAGDAPPWRRCPHRMSGGAPLDRIRPGGPGGAGRRAALHPDHRLPRPHRHRRRRRRLPCRPRRLHHRILALRRSADAAFLHADGASGSEPSSPPLDRLAHRFSRIAERFHMVWGLHDAQRRERLLILVSKLDHCLNDLLYRYRTGDLRDRHPGDRLQPSGFGAARPLARHSVPPPAGGARRPGRNRKQQSLVWSRAGDRSGGARPLHADPDARQLRPAARPLHQHPSFFPAGLQGQAARTTRRTPWASS